MKTYFYFDVFPLIVDQKLVFKIVLDGYFFEKLHLCEPGLTTTIFCTVYHFILLY